MAARAETFAEVELPEQAGVSTGRFGIHPVLLDAALHALGVADKRLETVLPFSWQGVSLHAAGASRVRVRLAPAPPAPCRSNWPTRRGSRAVGAGAGQPCRVGRAAGRAVAVRSGSGELLDVAWSVIEPRNSLPDNPISEGVTVWEPAAVDGAGPAAVHAATHQALGVLQSRLAGEAGGVLVVSTRGAVGLPGEDVADLAGAAVWGLVRSAQAEHPGRVVLVDTDGSLDLATVIGCGEPQLVVRDGVAYRARLRPAGRRALLELPGRRRCGGWPPATPGRSKTWRCRNTPPRSWPRAGAGAGGRGRVNFRDVLVALGCIRVRPSWAPRAPGRDRGRRRCHRCGRR
ncbi:phenolphthiocerol synthesis polyketide synthase type I Pks15/1 domain protein [Mycobacterium avium subsp. avium 2285 (R)]|nr:phenolphthiocerol synthesis polyketide synthase type I Pks15/1 domain protein [Mycobacterium avium subsp. avium 2285 (R)]